MKPLSEGTGNADLSDMIDINAAFLKLQPIYSQRMLKEISARDSAENGLSSTGGDEKAPLSPPTDNDNNNNNNHAKNINININNIPFRRNYNFNNRDRSSHHVHFDKLDTGHTNQTDQADKINHTDHSNYTNYTNNTNATTAGSSENIVTHFEPERFPYGLGGNINIHRHYSNTNTNPSSNAGSPPKGTHPVNNYSGGIYTISNINQRAISPHYSIASNNYNSPGLNLTTNSQESVDHYEMVKHMETLDELLLKLTKKTIVIESEKDDEIVQQLIYYLKLLEKSYVNYYSRYCDKDYDFSELETAFLKMYEQFSKLRRTQNK